MPSKPHPTSDAVRFALPDIGDAEVAAVVRVLRSGWLTTGTEAESLESELTAHLGVAHALAVSSCTAALEICAAYLRLGESHRVAVPTWTFVSSALAMARHGATPVLLDVDPDTLNLSPAAVAAAIEDGIDAVVAVHFGGVPVDAEILRMCADAGVPIIEDAAHALGARDERGAIRGAGTVGACLSFYATKNLTAGEGGALTTEDSDLAQFAASYRLHGLSADAWKRYLPGAGAGYDLEQAGIKANLPDLLAAVARVQLTRFEGMQARRHAIAARYRELLSDVDTLRFAPARPVPGSADHLVVVVLPEGTRRDDIVATMSSAGIGSSVHFRPLHTFRWFAEHAEIGRDGVAEADRLAPRVLSLPLHPGMTDSDVDRVCETLRSALGR